MNRNANKLNSADEPSVSGTKANFHQFVEPVMAPALTAGELVGIAHVLIDAEVVASLEPDAVPNFHAGALKGITAMCAAATSAINACGAAIVAQQAGRAPADQHGDAQSNQAVTPEFDGREQHPSASVVDNATHRALFSLPPIQSSAETALAVPELPPQHIITGDKEVDAVIWLRQVIGTGQPALIAKAKKAAKKIKAPLEDLEKRYSAYLARTNAGNLFATFGAVGFADLDGWETRSIEMAARRQEAYSRFGDALFENTPAESFCEDVLAGVKLGSGGWDLDKADVDARFDAHADQRPATLSDCLAERTYWDKLYSLRNVVDRDRSEGGMEASARRDYAFRCLGRILPRSTDEAHQVLQYLIDDDAMDWEESPGILRNLMTQTSASTATKNAAVSVLLRLDGYMAASGYDACHPWRREIVGATGPAEPCTLCEGAGGDFGESKYWHKCPHCDGRAVEPESTACGPDLSDRPDLQQLRAELDPDMQRMYPELLTPVAPPTRADILDLMVKLDAITCTGISVPEFAMEVISGLVAMIDVERLA